MMLEVLWRMLHDEFLVDLNMIFGRKLNIDKNSFKHMFSNNFSLRNRLKMFADNSKFWRKNISEK